MTLNEVLEELKAAADPKSAKILEKHGAGANNLGVKVADLKAIRKKTGKDHELALSLFDTGISDAMYLAGYVCDPAGMTPELLDSWAEKAFWQWISEFTVPWVAAESPHALEMALKWIGSERENVASSGWAALSSYLSITPDELLDAAMLQSLLDTVEKSIHSAPNRVRYAMNGFVIALGTYVKDLSPAAKEAALRIGKVSVDMNGTSCKVPFAPDYIEKAQKKGNPWKKRKTAFC